MIKLFSIFAAVFLAELGDKTQLATLLFATDGQNRPVAVFMAASLALVFSTAIAVLAGHFAAEHLNGLPLKLIAGLGFIAMGAWMLFEFFAGRA
ncbi:MAG: hypothetical protein C0605_08400 [Hyphomicrobiales bacterium]|nr:MAG: hypothetical protein C0605_08400 [Hyphomicrobiales bacterium]